MRAQGGLAVARERLGRAHGVGEALVVGARVLGEQVAVTREALGGRVAAVAHFLLDLLKKHGGFDHGGVVRELFDMV